MAKKAFCQHKSTEMISGVANYFAAPCTLLDVPRPRRPFWPQDNPLFRPPWLLQLQFLLVFVWRVVQMVCASSAHNTNTMETTNMANKTEPRFTFIIINSKSTAATNEILKFYFHPFIWRFSLSISTLFSTACLQFSTIKKLNNTICLIVPKQSRS